MASPQIGHVVSPVGILSPQIGHWVIPTIGVGGGGVGESLVGVALVSRISPQYGQVVRPSANNSAQTGHLFIGLLCNRWY